LGLLCKFIVSTIRSMKYSNFWAVLLALLLTNVAPAIAAPNVNVDWDCQANPPIGGAQKLSLGSTIDAQSPSNVAPGDIFEVALTAHPLRIPGDAAGYHLNNLRNVKLSVLVPSGTSFRSVSISGGSNLGGNPTVTQVNGVISLSIPGPIKAGSSF
jgi:dehydratase